MVSTPLRLRHFAMFGSVLYSTWVNETLWNSKRSELRYDITIHVYRHHGYFAFYCGAYPATWNSLYHLTSDVAQGMMRRWQVTLWSCDRGSAIAQKLPKASESRSYYFVYVEILLYILIGLAYMKLLARLCNYALCDSALPSSRNLSIHCSIRIILKAFTLA